MTPRALTLATLLLAPAALVGCSCDEEPGQAAPTIVLITVDTWRADHLDHVLTPHINDVGALLNGVDGAGV